MWRFGRERLERGAFGHTPHGKGSGPRGRQRKKSRTPCGEISWNQVEIMRNQSRFPRNRAQKSAQPSSPTHFYNYDVIFEGNHGEIKQKSGNLVRLNCSLPTPRSGPNSLIRVHVSRTTKLVSQDVSIVSIFIQFVCPCPCSVRISVWCKGILGFTPMHIWLL